MKSFIKIASSVLGVLICTVSCETEDFDQSITGQVPEKIKEKLLKVGVNPFDAELTTTYNADGQIQEVWVSGDIMFPSDQLFDYEDLAINADGSRAFRAHNLVDVGDSRVINIVSRGLGTKGDQALQEAVDVYNDLALKISFSLSIGQQEGDIVVYRNNDRTGYGKAYFPHEGNPGGAIEVNRELTTKLSINLWRQVLIHEIGHSIGLRHSDWRTRSSCDNSTEESTIDGVVHIPGTDDSGDYTNSIMKACFRFDEVINLTSEDLIALRYLYDTRGDTTADCAPNVQQCDQSLPWKYYFCGQCFESPQQAVDNGCQEANSCTNGGGDDGNNCQPNAQQCDQNLPWKYYFCGKCFESPQDAVNNGCQEASSCVGG